MKSTIEQTRNIKPWQISIILACITLFYITYMGITLLSLEMNMGIELASVNLPSLNTEILTTELTQKVKFDSKII